MNKPTKHIAPSLLTLEQMREIVAAADSIEHYRTQLAELTENLATGHVNWSALPLLLGGMNEAFAKFRSAATPITHRAPERPPTPPQPVDAPEDKSKGKTDGERFQKPKANSAPLSAARPNQG
jgi:hypothetical protein